MRAKESHIFDRDPLDWYVEPSRATAQLLSQERFIGPVWDPACGAGNTIQALAERGLVGIGTDIKRRAPAGADWFKGETDFLAATDPLAANIICNPPYFRAKGTEAFIRKAVALVDGKIAMFATLQFLAGSKRAGGLYGEIPPTRVWIITPRVSCPPGEYLAQGGKATGDTKDYCWLVWDRTAPTQRGPVVGWLTAADAEATAGKFNEKTRRDAA